VGAYGTINRKTGEFETEGNIYEDEATAQLAAKYPPQIGCKEHIFTIFSEGVKAHEFSLDPSM
jgi:hypothetical protein